MQGLIFLKSRMRDSAATDGNRPRGDPQKGGHQAASRLREHMICYSTWSFSALPVFILAGKFFKQTSTTM